MKELRILLVSSDQFHNAIVSMALSSLNCVIITSENALEALNLALMLKTSNRPLDLVLLHAGVVDFPVESFVAKLRSSDSEIPILILASTKGNKDFTALSRDHNAGVVFSISDLAGRAKEIILSSPLVTKEVAS